MLAFPPSEVHVPVKAPEGTDYIKGLEFSESSECKKQFKSAVESGRKFCQEYLKEHPNDRNLAIVSDLDETLLDNREEFRAHPTHDWAPFDAWVAEARAPSLKETDEFLTWARKQGIAIFFITGRPEHDRRATIQNLVKIGASYDGLYLRPEHNKVKAEVYKTAVREEIEKMGFKILVTIGDQDSDLAGGHALDCEKLPNRMYFIP
ncbi:MAG TPA: HAD family acid phosphatase [Chroococcales cyanobacterium]